MNTNCLEGMRCPKCGSEGPFAIEAKAVFEVHDDGTECYRDVEWEDDSFCECMDCGHWALVENFKGEPEEERV